MNRTETIVVDAELSGRRLDAVIAKCIAGLGRRGARTLFASGSVRVNGRVARKSDLGRAGDVITVTIAEPSPAPIELSTLVETDDYVIVDKPAGVPSCMLIGGQSTSVAHWLVGRYPEMAQLTDDPREAGLVHRLDTQTSGLLLAARHAPALERLRSALRQGQITKHYAAIVSADGLGARGCIELPIEAHPKRRRRVRIGSTGTARRTEWRVVEQKGPWALLEVEVSRAYRHQVRAHLAAIGHPIAGDATYGGPPASLGGRHALHASYIAWAGDDGLAGFTATAALPAELAALVRD